MIGNRWVWTLHSRTHVRIVPSMDLGSLTPEQTENVRRSVAMLPTGAMALNREDALEVLAELRRLQQAARELHRGLRELGQ